MKRLRPHIGFGLAGWLACTAPAMAQSEFYIELRGPESASPTPAAAPVPPSPTPAAAPVPPSASQPVTGPGRYGPVQSTDTLWSIAARHTRAPVTVQQTMVALYHLNPRAFVRGNINYLQRGVRLRLPTESQARQRAPRDAEAEFRRLSRQGNRSVARAATAEQAAVKPGAAAVPVATRSAGAPAAASPPVKEPLPVKEPSPVAAPPPAPQATPETPPAAPTDSAALGLTEPKAAAAPVPQAPPAETSPAAPTDSAAIGLTEPKAAAAPSVAAATMPDPAQAEEMALARLQLQLMDELREQVAMSNEQLANLADNNQLLRQGLSRLTAEVEELKQGRAAEAAPEPAPSQAGMGNALWSNALNLALILTLPALLLLAIFTLWWHKRVRQDLADQEQELSESTSAMMDDERNEFDDLFSAALEPAPTVAPEPAPEPDDVLPAQKVDEDAFARFLEEQQRMEEEEAEALSETLFDDEATLADRRHQVTDQVADQAAVELLFEDEMATDDHPSETRVSNDDIDELLFNTAPPMPNEEPEPEATSQQQAADTDYVSVDQLMAEANLSDGAEREFDRPLDLALDDYAGVLGQGQNVDIDLDEGGMGAKLDLARAYIEIDDIDSARELLNEALERGNEEQQRDAQKLLQRLARR
ncbi:pilus assembly protein FimV [Oceanisphaera litoralis]|uniref:FimV/HubP family polar landmark protein n=1 Tax=Oceanisphaera litoralis TaxID=225144 RepID=UPI001959445B|nr:FimV/HubP family polar landmark protein [Oceanisphaera litoralis]MBM7455072.1 pilus assembly protein FimV [Oceanisphaera litoralis]